MRGTPNETCRTAVAAIRQLRVLARRTGYPPSRTDELGKLVAEVEAAAKSVRLHTDAIQGAAEPEQQSLF